MSRAGLLGLAILAVAFGSAECHSVALRGPAGVQPIRRIALVRPGAAPTKAMLESVGSRILTGATQGAVGAVVAATLSAFTEPVVNRILVQRISVVESIRQLDLAKSRKFFATTLPTNFLKFPLFEAVNCVMMAVNVPDSIKGLVTGFLFTTLTLPVTNYRFCKSMELPVNAEALFKAYIPTVARDIIYGISRNKISTSMALAYPLLMGTTMGRATLLFPTVLASCIISSPGNELRGYYLQPKEKRLGFRTFFKPKNYIRSTTAGALIMAISLSVGALVTTPVKMLLAQMRALYAALLYSNVSA